MTTPHSLPQISAQRTPAANLGPATQRSVGELLARVGQGSREAFATLYDLTAGAVFGLAHRMLSSTGLAQQVTQEVFVQIWRQASRFHSKDAGLAWIMGLAHTKVRHGIRHLRSAHPPGYPHGCDGYAVGGHPPELGRYHLASDDPKLAPPPRRRLQVTNLVGRLAGSSPDSWWAG